jgi:hypothetical protein
MASGALKAALTVTSTMIDNSHIMPSMASDFPEGLMDCVHINIICNKLINFCKNRKLSTIIYDYLETSHTIDWKRSRKPSPKKISH